MNGLARLTVILQRLTTVIKNEKREFPVILTQDEALYVLNCSLDELRSYPHTIVFGEITIDQFDLLRHEIILIKNTHTASDHPDLYQLLEEMETGINNVNNVLKNSSKADNMNGFSAN